MDIVVVGKHRDVDSRLRALTVEKVERVNKFASDVRRIEVDYEHHPTRRAEDSHTCEILVHVRQHLGEGHRGRHRVRDRARPRARQGRAADAPAARTPGRAAERLARTDGARAVAGTADPTPTARSTTSEEDDESRALVKTKQFSVKPMDVEEAALQMELLGHDFFLFTNAESGVASVIYRRRDGRLGLIEATG